MVHSSVERLLDCVRRTKKIFLSKRETSLSSIDKWSRIIDLSKCPEKWLKFDPMVGDDTHFLHFTEEVEFSFDV